MKCHEAEQNRLQELIQKEELYYDDDEDAQNEDYEEESEVSEGVKDIADVEVETFLATVAFL